jgi:hypothetical protein
MATYEELHYEHLRWLSEVTFWQDEINFLKKLCLSLDNSNGLPIDSCLNKLAHHERMLVGMKQQITSHENFLKDMIRDDGQPCDGNTVDHEHNRDHMNNFKESLKKLKKDIFQMSHNKVH